MVATVGSISIDLSTNLAKFSTGFKSAATTVDQQSARMSKSVLSIERALSLGGVAVRSFIGGLVGGAGFQALTSFTGAVDKARKALSDFEEIGNRSKTVGLTTQTFQALSFGAAQADVEQEKLNKSLEIFAKNVGLAREGTGSLYSGLLKLNPELLKSVLQAGDQEQRLKLVAEAMKQTTDATQRAALAQAAFGKGGIDLVRVLDGGAASIEKFKQTARDLGIIIPDDLIQRAGELDDELEVLGKVIDVNLSQALVKLAPLLVTGSEGAALLATKINELSSAIVNAKTGDYTGLIVSVGQYLEQVAKIFPQMNLINGLPQVDLFGGEDVRDVQLVRKEINEVQKVLFDLYKDAEKGANVELDIGGALQKLDLLRQELADVQRGASLAASAATRAAGVALGSVVNGIFRNTASQPLPTTPNKGVPFEPRRGITSGTPTNQPIDPDALEDIEDAIRDGTDSAADGRFVTAREILGMSRGLFAETFGEGSNYDQTMAKMRACLERTEKGVDRVGNVSEDGFSGLQRTAEVGSAEVADLLRRGIPLNYSSISAAVRTGIITGMDQANLKQYKISTPDTLFPTFGSGDDTETESSRLEAQLERLKLQASTVGSLAADAFAVRISQLELRLFDAKVAEEKSTTDTDLFRKTFGGPSYAGAFADGGSFKVGGNQTGDSNLIMLRANEGETVSVSQGGQRPIIFNYHAAAGESERTARQNARSMLEVMQRESARS